MRVREVMESIVVSIPPETTYEQAVKVMCEHSFSGLPVIDKRGKLVGLISEKDLFRALYPKYEEFARRPEDYFNREAQEENVNSIRNNPIGEYMTKEVLVIAPDAPIMKAGGLMIAYGVHRLPVVEDGKLVGIVTREQIFKTLLKRQLGC